MVAPSSRDTLDGLHLLLNDVLVQTGKALRASRRDSHGNLGLTHGVSQSKLPDTIQAFHTTLDELESEIVKAKSVLLRDLNLLQADKSAKHTSQLQLQPVLPIESQTKEPISIDDDSPTPLSPVPSSKPAPAPFPVMDAGDIINGNSIVKEENMRLPQGNITTNTAVKSESTAAPEAPMMADANFTDMEFSLAPADGTQNQNTAGSFDLSSFAPNSTMLSLDNLLPNNGQAADAGATNTAATAVPEGIKAEPSNDEGNADNSNFEEFFGNDTSQADGMDFDFSIGGSGGNGGGGGSGGSGGGMGEDTFDDLMNDRDGTFELMSNEDFDAAFFGLDNKDGS